jgi:hypothetical protein
LLEFRQVALKVAPHERAGAALFTMSAELPEEGLEVVADNAVKHPMLQRDARGGAKTAEFIQFSIQVPR